MRRGVKALRKIPERQGSPMKSGITKFASLLAYGVAVWCGNLLILLGMGTKPRKTA